MDLSQIIIFISFIVLSLILNQTSASIKRCFSCRSRGELGSCKDKFKFYNASQLEFETGVEAVPCASGWCGKVIETSDHDLKVEEYGVATQRMCLQRSPSDNEQRCDVTNWGRKKVFMCFCQGDLCNYATIIKPLSIFVHIIPFFCCIFYCTRMFSTI